MKKKRMPLSLDPEKNNSPHLFSPCSTVPLSPNENLSIPWFQARRRCLPGYSARSSHHLGLPRHRCTHYGPPRIFRTAYRAANSRRTWHTRFGRATSDSRLRFYLLSPIPQNPSSRPNKKSPQACIQSAFGPAA